MQAVRRAALASALTLYACGQPEEVDKPTAPHMDEIVTAYRDPQRDFDRADSDWIADELRDRTQALEQAGLIDALTAALDSVLEQAEQGSSGRVQQPSHTRLLEFTGSGFARATRICDGWVTPPVPDRETNGFMEFVVGFTDDHLDPVLFGTLEHCRYLSGKQRVLLTAASDDRPALSIHLGGAERARDVEGAPLTYDINLRGKVGSDDVRLQFDFRLRPNGNIEYRMPAQGDSLVVTTQAGIPLRIRARNGEFSCDETLVCVAPDAGSSVR